MQLRAPNVCLLAAVAVLVCSSVKAQEEAATILSSAHTQTVTTSNYWNQIGPQPELDLGTVHFSAMVFAVAIDPRNSEVVYVGSPSGGVWKTTDGGDHFVPL